MKLTIDSTQLNKALRRVQPAISTNRIIPVLEYIKCNISGDILLITATNLNLTIINMLDCSANESFECLLPFKELLNITAILAEPIEIKIGKLIEIKHFSGKYQLGIPVDANTFPKMPVIQALFSEELTTEFLEAMQTTKNFVMKTEINAQYAIFKNGCIEIKNKEISIKASDTTQMFRYKEACNNKGECRLVFDTMFMTACSGFETGILSWDERFVMITTLTSTVICTQSEYPYPDVDRVFKPHEPNFEIEREDLLTAINKMMVFDSQFFFFGMEFKKGQVELQYHDYDLEQHFEAVIKNDHSVPGGLINFNGRFFKNTLQATPAGKLRFTFGAETDNVYLDTDNENINLLIRPLILIQQKKINNGVPYKRTND